MWECLELTRGTHHATTPPHRAAGVWAAPWHGVGPTWPSTHPSSSHFFLSPDQTHHHCSNPCSCCSCSRFFDLLAQPIFVAEIWTICSPVCDSSMYPSRILFSRVYLEYFAAVGDLLSEYACLFYVDIISFDACLVL